MNTSILPTRTTSTGTGSSALSDWGPARHDPEDPRSSNALRASLDQWDAGHRPDDN